MTRHSSLVCFVRVHFFLFLQFPWSVCYFLYHFLCLSQSAVSSWSNIFGTLLPGILLSDMSVGSIFFYRSSHAVPIWVCCYYPSSWINLDKLCFNPSSGTLPMWQSDLIGGFEKCVKGAVASGNGFAGCPRSM